MIKKVGNGDGAVYKIENAKMARMFVDGSVQVKITYTVKVGNGDGAVYEIENR